MYNKETYELTLRLPGRMEELVMELMEALSSLDYNDQAVRRDLENYQTCVKNAAGTVSKATTALLSKPKVVKVLQGEVLLPERGERQHQIAALKQALKILEDLDVVETRDVEEKEIKP